MTNEEAIAYFKRHIDLYCVDGISREAEEMAIKALEQQPCDNAISRQAVLERAINVPIAKIVTNDKVICRKVVFVDDIENLPPVTPQQKYGKWIFVDKAKEHAHCSECDYGNVDLFDGRSHNYCPNCGAKMQEVEE